MPSLEQWEIKKYWEIFQGLKPENKKLLGSAVLPVLKNLRLPDSQLAQIWQLLDIDEDGLLDFEEFCIAMRLIFDIVNGSATLVPSELPQWLVPQSKAHLVLANVAVTSRRNVGMEYDDSDEEASLADDFDWYISPTDKATYELVYLQHADKFGRIKFDALEPLYAGLPTVPRSDISSAWNLVNPKLFETIDKDQALVFLHILQQRQKRKRVPRGVPASLRATFSKEAPNYSLETQAAVPAAAAPPPPKAFASDYLSKFSTSSGESGTDFLATQGTDWEQVRLKRELADLESVLQRIRGERGASGSGSASTVDPELALQKYELEQMLKYMQQQQQSGDQNTGQNLLEVRADIELIEQQVAALQEVANSRAQELASVEREIASLG